MATILITLKVMAELNIDMIELEKKIKKEIESFGGNVAKVEKIPIGFGIESLNFTFSFNESKGSTEFLEEKISKINEVSSVEVIDIRRAIG